MPELGAGSKTREPSIVLDPSALKWLGVRFLDPLGRVFEFRGDFYRAIYPEKVAYVDGLFASGLIGKLVDRGLLIEMQPCELSVEGFGRVLKMRGAPWRIPGHMYTRRTLRAAALAWLEINEMLLPHGLCLVDAHLANFVLCGRCRPLWVDLGSIVPLERGETGFNQFVRCQLYPLWILARGAGWQRIARLLIQDGGVGSEEYRRLGALPNLRSPLARLLVDSSLPWRAARRLLIDNRILSRRRILRAFRAAVEAVDPAPHHDRWTSYRSSPLPEFAGAALEASTDTRPGKVLELIRRIRPKTVLDIGANDGYFAAMAATEGAAVLAVDPDEGAIDKFTRWIAETGTDVEAFACVGSFHKVTQKAELVLALALTHHLALTQRYKFDYIAARLASMSTSAMITEFMPYGVGGDKLQPDPLPSYYRLEVFLAELSRYFAQVEPVAYARPDRFSPRTLILCSGRRPDQ